MKIFTSALSNCAVDCFLRFDEKYHKAIEENLFNLFQTNNTIRLSEILKENYCIFDYEEGKTYYGIPTGQTYIDCDGNIIDSQIVSIEDHPDRLKYKVNSNNILLSSLRLAKSPALNFEMDNLSDFVFSNGFYIFDIKNDWNKKFVLYVLRSSKLKNLIDNNIYRGIGISSYKIEDLFKCSIREIALEEQQKTVELILPYEENISLLKSKEKPLQQIIDAVFQKEFGFDYDKFEELKKIKRYSLEFVNYSNNPDLRFSAKFHRPAGEYVESELRRIGERRFKHYLAEPIVLGASVSPTDFDEMGSTYYISMATIKSFKVELDETQLLSQNYVKWHEVKRVHMDDIIMNRSGVAIGKVALIEEETDGIFADFTMRIRLKNYNTVFAYYYMRSTYFQYLIEIYKKGLQNQNIFPIVIQEFPLPDISLDEQQRIVDEIKSEIDKQNDIKNQIASLRAEIDKIIENAVKSTE